MEILTNPIVVSVIVMSVLCLLKMNALFAILVAAIVAGATGGLPIDKTVSILIGKPLSATSCWGTWQWPSDGPVWQTLQHEKSPKW